MTDKEILEYSASIIAVKSEIESGEAAEPDLNEQVQNKFSEDSVNRAKFIDSALVLGATSKEFRNVFGIDAPHYEIEDDCCFEIDIDENAKFDEAAGDKKIEVDDPLRNDNQRTTDFTDCWELINAARFDSTCKTEHGLGYDKKLPKDKQRFFVDFDMDKESSAVHAPICPPGFGKWAGEFVYDSICRSYDLTEFVLYRILSSTDNNTIPNSFELGEELLSKENAFEFAIDTDGKLRRGEFTYSFKQEATSDLIEYMARNVNMPYNCVEENRKYKGDTEKPTIDGEVKTKDSSPIRWFEKKIPVESIQVGDEYYYKYDFSNTPFEYTDTPIVELVFSKLDVISKRDPFKEFNRAIAILALDTLNSKPKNGKEYKTQDTIRYCVHLIWAENETFDAGDDKRVPHHFLFWDWETTAKQYYTVVATPINSFNYNLKFKIAQFIKNIEYDCLKYYNKIKERNISHLIPDSETSVKLIKNVYEKARYCEECFNPDHPASARACGTSWKSLISALKDRVIYNIFGTTNVPYKEKNKALKTKDVISHEVRISPICDKTYIKEWISKYVPGWPRWLRRLFSWWSEPIYADYHRFRISSVDIIRNFNHQNTYSGYTTSVSKYLGPSNGDLTSILSSNNMVSTYTLVNEILTEADRNYLAQAGIINRSTNPTWIKLDGTTEITISQNDSYEIVYETMVEEAPSYDNIARAQSLNLFLSKNENLFQNSFFNLKDRIDKRTGTLRKTCKIFNSVNINSQMINQKKMNIANLFQYENAYAITGGFGTNTATISLATWEPYTEAYANLNRLDTVYLLSDITTIKERDEKGSVINKFNSGYVKAIITDIIDLVSRTEYDYSITKNNDVDIKDEYAKGKNNRGKHYYKHDADNQEYVEVETLNEALLLLENHQLYERGMANQGPIFKVKLNKAVPLAFENRNPRLVKVY